MRISSLRRPRHALLCTTFALLTLTLGACSGEPEPSAAVRALEAPTTAPRAADIPTDDGADKAPASDPPPPAGTLERKLHDAAERYAAGWEAGDVSLSGELARGERRSFMTLLRYGRCYRFVAAGDQGLADLDLNLYDAQDVVVQHDGGQDATPVLGLQAHICPPKTDTYRLEAHAYAGAGRFLITARETAH